MSVFKNGNNKVAFIFLNSSPQSTIIYIEEQESLVHVGAANNC